MGKTLLLRRVAGKCEPDLKILRKSIHYPGMISEVKSVISEFMQYGIGASYNSKIFSEANYFEQTYLPLDAVNMGSDAYSGTIKSYNDKFDNDVTNYTISNREIETTRSDASFKIAAGYEHHIVNNGRLNIYIGGELGYRGEFYSAEREDKFSQENYNLTTTGTYNTINEVKRTYNEKTEWTDGDDLGNASNHSFFAQAFTGLDFYIYKGLYVGTELGIRFSATSYVNPTSKTTHNENQDNITRYTGTGIPATAKAVTVNTKTDWTFTSEDGRTIGKTVVNNPAAAAGTPVVTETDIKTINPTGATENTRTTARLNVYIEPAIRLGWKF